MLETTIGVSTDAALSGFDAAWTEKQQQHNRPYHTHSLFPEPLRSVVVVPEGLDRGIQQDKAIPTVTNTMGLGLDYRDWDATETTGEESWSEIANK